MPFVNHILTELSTKLKDIFNEVITPRSNPDLPCDYLYGSYNYIDRRKPSPCTMAEDKKIDLVESEIEVTFENDDHNALLTDSPHTTMKIIMEGLETKDGKLADRIKKQREQKISDIDKALEQQRVGKLAKGLAALVEPEPAVCVQGSQDEVINPLTDLYEEPEDEEIDNILESFVGDQSDADSIVSECADTDPEVDTSDTDEEMSVPLIQEEEEPENHVPERATNYHPTQAEIHQEEGEEEPKILKKDEFKPTGIFVPQPPGWIEKLFGTTPPANSEILKEFCSINTKIEETCTFFRGELMNHIEYSKQEEKRAKKRFESLEGEMSELKKMMTKMLDLQSSTHASIGRIEVKLSQVKGDEISKLKIATENMEKDVHEMYNAQLETLHQSNNLKSFTEYQQKSFTEQQLNLANLVKGFTDQITLISKTAETPGGLKTIPVKTTDWKFQPMTKNRVKDPKIAGVLFEELKEKMEKSPKIQKGVGKTVQLNILKSATPHDLQKNLMLLGFNELTDCELKQVSRAKFDSKEDMAKIFEILEKNARPLPRTVKTTKTVSDINEGASTSKAPYVEPKEAKVPKTEKPKQKVLFTGPVFPGKN